jgi:hypothetical protein
MCPYEETGGGAVASSTANMQKTGRSWSKKGEEHVVNNAGLSGFYIGECVSRYRTDNKLFRVTDPRGFMLEISAENLSKLIQETTVVKGYIEEKCLWAREGSRHRLILRDSEEHKKALEVKNTLENELISIKQLSAGDVVRNFGSGAELIFLGRVKITWDIRSHTPRSYWSQVKEETYGEYQTVEDDKYVNLFANTKASSSGKHYASEYNRLKIVEIVRNEKVKLKGEDLLVVCPQRIENKLRDFVDLSEYSRVDTKVKSYKLKPVK